MKFSDKQFKNFAELVLQENDYFNKIENISNLIKIKFENEILNQKFIDKTKKIWYISEYLISSKISSGGVIFLRKVVKNKFKKLLSNLFISSKQLTLIEFLDLISSGEIKFYKEK